MKKILPYIFIALIFVNLFAPFTLEIHSSKVVMNTSIANADDDDCKISTVTPPAFTPKGQQIPGWFVVKTTTVTLNVSTTNCIGERARISVWDRDDIDEPVFTSSDQKITSDNFSLEFIPGEEDCDNGKCRIGFYIALTNAKGKVTEYFIPSDTYEASEADELLYNCAAATCSDNVKWTLKSVSGLGQTIQITTETYRTKNAVGVKGFGPEDSLYRLNEDDTLTFKLFDSSGKLMDKDKVGGSNPIVKNVIKDLYKTSTKKIEYIISFTGLEAATTYTIQILPSFNGNSLIPLNKKIDLAISTLTATGQLFGTGPSNGSVTTLNQEQKDRDNLPACGIVLGQDGTIYGCVAQVLYYALFAPTSFLFGLAGTFFDNTFNYSVQDSSYRSAFVVQGWGIVRDLCNMFFIFVLLYVAFATILDLHGFNTKSTIINVVIIGILINFSLFTTQVIIDSSNILARVFYNSDTIKITEGGANTTNQENQLGINGGVIPLSAALVNKVNPQNLIINASSVSKIPDKGGQGADAGISAGTFILITILATGINIVGFLTFLSVGLIFVARVIGLWFAMILVPLTFFTYMVPQMQSFSMVGWKKWWPETLQLAFLAPVFIFFLYLILKFLQIGLGVFDAQGKEGIEFVVAIVMPFAFIMVLLNRAKGIAKSMSGQMGEAVTGAMTAVGGAAIGVATGGAAMAMRGVVGRGANWLNNKDSLNNLAAGKRADGSELKNKNLFTNFRQKAAIATKKTATAGAKGSFDARQTGVANALSSQLGLDLNKYTGAVGLDSKAGLGGYKNYQAKKIAKEEEFAKTLGYDHDKDHALQETIDKINGQISNAEAVRDKQKAVMEKTKAGTPEHEDAKMAHGQALANIAALKYGGATYEDTKEKAKYLEERRQMQGNPPKQPEPVKPLNSLATQAMKDQHEKDIKAYENENRAYEQYQAKMKDLNEKIANAHTETSVKGLNEFEKEQKTNKTGREREYYLYKRNQSGKLFNDVKRDENGNIKSFGHAKEDAEKAGKQIMKEFFGGFMKGAIAGATVGSIAGPVGATGGAVAGGLYQGIRDLVSYSSKTNLKVGEAHNPKPEKGEDKYKPGKSDGHGGGGGHDDHGGGHDDHGGGHDDHGGGHH